MANGKSKTAPTSTVLIGGHFAPKVRRALFLVQAQPETAGKSLKQLLAEAINDLCSKYAKRRPNAVGETRVLLEPKACEICGKLFVRVIVEIGEKLCSVCEERLIVEKRNHERTLKVAKRERPDSRAFPSAHT